MTVRMYSIQFMNVKLNKIEVLNKLKGVISMREYLCMQDWGIDSGIYFEKGKKYEGIPSKDGRSVKMFGEVGMVITFHEGSKYFKI